jgi:glycosyltransferase involved in cell wall biosynthesis
MAARARSRANFFVFPLSNCLKADFTGKQRRNGDTPETPLARHSISLCRSLVILHHPKTSGENQMSVCHYYMDCERMRHPKTGIYEFCTGLGNAIAAQLGGEEHLTCYAPLLPENTFDRKVLPLRFRHYHKFLFPRLEKPAVWLGTYQKSSYLPSRSVPVVQTIHDLNFIHEDKSEQSIERNLAAVQKNMDRARAVVAISEFVASEILRYQKIDEKKLHVIPNGCARLCDRNVTRPAFAPEKPYLFALGPTIPKKNFHVLPCLLRNNRYDLYIAGHTEPAYLGKILGEAQKHGVAERVFILGPVSENDKIWYYKNCTAFLFPSLAEGFGLPVVEAMQFGKPVFLSNATALPEIGGDCAHYFDSFDPERMNRFFNNVMSLPPSPGQADKIRKHAESFTWEKAAEQYLKLLREWIGDSPR